MAQKKFLYDIDLCQNQIINAVSETRASAPENPIQGQRYFDTTDKVEKVFDGVKWLTLATGGDASHLARQLEELTDEVRQHEIEEGDTSVELTPNQSGVGTKLKVKIQQSGNDIKLGNDGIYSTPYTADENTLTKTGNQFSVKPNVFDTYGSSATAEQNAKDYADEVADDLVGTAASDENTDTIKGAKRYADAASATAEQNAKDYVDDIEENLIGTASDTASADTIKGAKKYTDSKLQEAKDYTDEKVGAIETEIGQVVKSVSAANNSIEIGGTSNNPTVKVKVPVNANNGLYVGSDGLYAQRPKNYNFAHGFVVAQSPDGYNFTIGLSVQGEDDLLYFNESDMLCSSLSLNIDQTADAQGKRYIKLIGNGGKDLGKIDISEFIKDSFLSDAEVVTDPQGMTPGTYIKFTFNTSEGETLNPIYLNVSDFVTDYTNGNGLDLNNHQFSIKIAQGESYLEVTSNGLKTTTALQTAINNAAQAGIDAAATEQSRAEGVESGHASRISALETAVGTGGSVDTKIQNAVNALDASVEATGTPSNNGVFVIKKINEVDGKVTTTGSIFVEVEQAGAAATAESNAKDYADTLKTQIESAAVKTYTTNFTSGNSGSISASTHKCGTYPLIQTYWDGSLVECAVTINANGDVSLAWNGSSISSSKPLTVRIIG